jgi:Taurine catabolism dioxygenase TauD, TfdA family
VQAAWEFDQILNDDNMAVELKMAEGTCAIFENRRVVHARNAFKTEEGGGGEARDGSEEHMSTETRFGASAMRSERTGVTFRICRSRKKAWSGSIDYLPSQQKKIEWIIHYML